MRTCRELIEFLMSYLDGDLPKEQRATFEQHLAVCADCVDYVATYRRTRELAASVRDDDEVPPDVPEDLVRAILDARERAD